MSPYYLLNASYVLLGVGLLAILGWWLHDLAVLFVIPWVQRKLKRKRSSFYTSPFLAHWGQGEKPRQNFRRVL